MFELLGYDYFYLGKLFLQRMKCPPESSLSYEKVYTPTKACDLL